MSKEVLPPPSTETLKKIWSYFNLNEHGVKEAVDSLKKWLEMQPHLPNTCEDDALAIWLIRCKNSLERTKESIDMYYTMRTLAPEYLTDRDTRSEWFQKITSLVYCIPMPELTDNLDRVVPMGVLDPDSTFFDLDLVIKALIMLSDVLLREDHHLSNIGIIDMKNYTLGHVTKTTVPQLKKYCVVLFNTYKIRARAIHFINTPPYAGYVLELIKSVIGSKLAARIQIHGTDLSGLHKHIPKRLLPTEHGGDAGPIARYHEAWIKKMATYNDWYKEQENVKSDETKRQGRSRTCGDLFGIEGSFRKLNVD